MRGRGISLIETVISVTLLALATLVALSALPTSTILSNRARFRIQALQLAQSQLERERALPWKTIAVWPYQETLPPYTLEGTGIVFESKLEISQAPPQSADHLRRILVTVEWKERDKTYSVQHESMLSHVPRF